MGIKKRFSKKDKKIVYEVSSKYRGETTKGEFSNKKDAEKFLKQQEKDIKDKENFWYDGK